MADELTFVDDVAGQPQDQGQEVSTEPQEELVFAQSEEDIATQQERERVQGEIKENFGDVGGAVLDKILRFGSGVDSILAGALATPRNVMHWAASKIWEEDFDTPEERQRAAEALFAAQKQSTLGRAFAGLEENLRETSEKVQATAIDDHEGRDFIDLAEEGNYLEAADAFTGEIASALPSVVAAMTGAGGLAVIGGSAFSSKYEEGVESDREVSMDRIFINSISSAGGELASEALTAGLAGGLGKLASRVGPKAYKAVMKNTGTKLATAFGLEGGSEVAAEAWDKLGDYAILGDKESFDGAVRDFGKTFLIGGVIGSGMTISQLRDGQSAGGGTTSNGPEIAKAVADKLTPAEIKDSLKQRGGELSALYADWKTAEELGEDGTVIDAIRDEYDNRAESLEAAKDRIYEQFEELGPEQIEELNRLDNEINALEQASDPYADEYNDYHANEVLKRQIEKKRARQAKVFSTKHEAAESSVKLSKKAQKQWENNVPAVEVAENFRGRAKQVAGKLWAGVPKGLRTADFNDVVNGILTDHQGVKDLVESYDPAKSDSLGAWVNSQIQNRANRIIKNYTKQSFDKNIDDVGDFAYEPKKRRSATTIAQGIQVPTSATEKVRAKAVELGTKVKDFKSNEEFVKAQEDAFKSIDIRKDLKGKNWNNWVTENAENLRQLALLSGKGWGRDWVGKVQKAKEGTKELEDLLAAAPTVQEFIDFATGKDGARIDSRQNGIIKRVEAGLAELAWAEHVANNPDLQKAIAEVNQVKKGKLMAKFKQPVYDNVDVTAFQEAMEDGDVEAQGGSIEWIWKELFGGKEKLKRTSAETRAKYHKEALAAAEQGLLPPWVIKAVKTAAAGGKNGIPRRGGMHTGVNDPNLVELLEVAEANYKGPVFNPKRVHINDKSLTPEAIAKNKEQQAENHRALEAFGHTLEKLTAFPTLSAILIHDGYKNTEGIIKIAAPLKYASKVMEHGRSGKQNKGVKYREEHAIPASIIGAYLASNSQAGTWGKIFPHVKKNFVQMMLSKKDDQKFDDAKLADVMPKGWKMTDNVLARYFNTHLIKETGGIDPDGLYDVNTGQTVSELLGLKGKLAAKIKDNTLKVPQRAKEELDFLKKQIIPELIKEGYTDGLEAYDGSDILYDRIDALDLSDAELDALQDAITIELNPKTEGPIGGIAESLRAAQKLLSPKQEMLDMVLWQRHRDAQDNSVQLYDAGARMLEVLKNAWAGAINATSDSDAAARHLLEAGQFDNIVDANVYVDSVEGFKLGDFVFVHPEVQVETPIHEFAHIWNAVIHEKNPLLFENIFYKIRTEAPALFDEQLDRIAQSGYKLEPESIGWKDEIMAGILGAHGNMKVVEAQAKSDKKWSQLFKEWWDTIGNFLGININDKSPTDLTVEDMLDLITDEIIQGKPKSNLQKLDKEGWRTISRNRRDPGTIAHHLKKDPTFNAMQEVKKVFEDTGDLSQALEQGYNLAKKEFPNYDDFAAIFKDVAKVKLRKEGSGITLAKAAVIHDTINAKKDQLAKEAVNTFKKDFTNVVNQGLDRKPSSIFISSNAEDFSGLLEALLPKGRKNAAQGVANQKWLKENLMDPYTNALNAAEAHAVEHTNLWKQLSKDVNLSQEVAKGFTVSDAILYAAAQQQGVDLDVSPDVASAFQAHVDGANLKAMVDYIANDAGINVTSENLGTPINRAIYSAITKNGRKLHMKEFTDKATAILNDPSIWAALDKSKGKKYSEALRSALTRMKEGRNRNAHDSQANTFNKWLGRAVGTTMFFNTRSAALQLISTINYVTKPGVGYSGLIGAWTTNRAEAKKAAKELLATGYMKARVKGDKFDLLADEIGSSDSWIDKMLTKGFSLTKWGDKSAIIWGGVPFYMARQKQLKVENPDWSDAQIKKQAQNDFVATTEESQQSSDPSRISQVQASSIGKIIYAFANTPFQYARITKRRINDLASGRSAKKGTVKQDLREAVWYSSTQAAIFTGLQQGIVALAFAEKDDEETEKKLWNGLNSILTSVTKTMGNHGAVAAALWGVLDAAYVQGKSGKDAAIKGLGISPPLQTKFKDLEKAINASKKAHKDDDLQQALVAIGEFGAFNGVPIDRVLKKANNLATWFNEEAELYQKIFRTLGWSDWDVGGGNLVLPEYKGNKKKAGDLDLGVELDLDLDLDLGLESPLNKLGNGEMGQAHRGGTIEVDPNLSGVEREKTIRHEREHIKQMKEDGLDYDDNYVYYKGGKHKRENGMIQFKGKMYQEGARELPWEAEAYKAE